MAEEAAMEGTDGTDGGDQTDATRFAGVVSSTSNFVAKKNQFLRASIRPADHLLAGTAYKISAAITNEAPPRSMSEGGGPRSRSGAKQPVKTIAPAVAKPFQILSANLITAATSLSLIHI